MTDYNLLGAKRVLVLAPHPDDETLGCGGTIALLSSSGAAVHVVVVSDGGKIPLQFIDKQIDIVETRKKESEEAAKVLGIQQTYFLGYPDGELRGFRDGIEADIAQIIERFKPDMILSPSPLDHHDDHIAISRIAEGLVRRRGNVRLAFFQVYGTLRFNSLIDITGVIERKEAAILRYHYSLLRNPGLFVEAEKGISRFWSFYVNKEGYYESFFIVPDSASIEIMEWLTYGERKRDPDEVFFSELKAVDELLAEEKKSAETIVSLESEIGRLQSEAARREDLIAQLNADIASKTEGLTIMSRHGAALTERLDKMTGSVFWKVAAGFYTVRDRLLPQSSSRRKVYDRLAALIKK